MTRLVVYGLLGLVLTSANIDYTTEWFWCVLGLFIVSDYLSRQQGFEQGVIQGMAAYSVATEQQRADIDRIVKDMNND